MTTATLTSKGQITLPASVRQALGLSTGDRIAFEPQPDGSFRVAAVRKDVRTLKGRLAGRTTRPVPVEAFDDAIAAGMLGRVGRHR